jgi:hypothetical protein
MPIISSIPTGYQEGFKQLSVIDSDKFNAIAEGLSSKSFASSITKLIEKISKLQNIPSEDFEDIFLSVGSLVDFLDKGFKIRDLVKDIVSAGKDDQIIKFKDEIEEKEYNKRLSFLLANQQIYYASKANDLATELGSIFLRSKVVTDIRPIFNVSLDDPKVGLITHTLHIHYNSCEESGHRDIYISLDSNDIAILRLDLERAQQKEDNLRSMFKKMEMINLNE